MEHRSTNSGLTIEGRIDTKVHSADELRSAIPEWDELSKDEKMLVTRDPEDFDLDALSPEEREYAEMFVEPDEEQVSYNVTTDRFHQYFVDNLDPSQSAAKDNVTASWLALGDDGATGTATSDTDLNNRVYSEAVTDHADNSKELLASTFVDSTEANGNSLDELGLFTGDPANIANDEVFLINHTDFGAVTKDNSKTVTFDVTLSFSDV